MVVSSFRYYELRYTERPPWELLTWFSGSEALIFGFLVQFYINIPNLSLIWNGSILIGFGSLRALNLIFRLWHLDFRIPCSILYKCTKFGLNLEWLHFYRFRLLESSDLIFRLWDIDFRNSRLKLRLWTKFYADWTILIFLMTSWPHPNCHAQRVWVLENGLGLL